MRILFCGGGTAGHITPAIAIAEALKEINPSVNFLFVGRENGEENRVITNKGYPLATVKINGFERKISINNLKNAYIAVKALRQSKKILQNFAPDAVLGTGGYVTWPIVKSAVKMKIPVLIHESNASPGLVTKLLAPKCDLVLLNLHGSEKHFKRKENLRIVGNPVREDFSKLTKQTARKQLGISASDFLITSFGGSGGSEAINREALNIMKIHSSKNPKIKHIHATGIKYYESAKEKYPEFSRGCKGCLIKPYIDNMPQLLTASDIVISRSGAMTIAELSAAGAASILIPSPNVTDNHQYKNAKLISDMGGAFLIEEKDLNERTLSDAVYRLETDEILRKSMQRIIKTFYFENSRDEIVNSVLSLIK